MKVTLVATVELSRESWWCCFCFCLCFVFVLFSISILRFENSGIEIDSTRHSTRLIRLSYSALRRRTIQRKRLLLARNLPQKPALNVQYGRLILQCILTAQHSNVNTLLLPRHILNSFTFYLESVYILKKSNNTMKLLALSTVRTGNELPDPIIGCFEAELSSFGFFQRPVSTVQ